MANLVDRYKQILSAGKGLINRIDESTTLDEKVGSFARGLTNATIQGYKQPANNFRNNRQSISNFMSKPRDFSNNRVVQGMEAINRSKPYRHLENLAVGTARGTTFGIVDPVKQFGLRELNTPLGNVTRGGAGLTMALTSGSQVIKGAKALPKVGSGITRLSTNLGNRGILGKGLSEVVQGSPLTLAYGAGSLANSFRGGENRVGRDIATDVGFDMAMGTLGPLGRGVAGFVDNKTLAKGLGSVRNDQLKESAQTILNRIKINRANGLKDTHRTQKALTKEYNKILDQMARNRKLGLSMGIIGGSRAKNGKPNFSNILDQEPRFEIDDSKAKIKTLKNANLSNKLGDILDHPQLFENYPQLKDIMIAPSRSVGKGSYYPSMNMIKVPAKQEQVNEYSRVLKKLTQEGKKLEKQGKMTKEWEINAEKQLEKAKLKDGVDTLKTYDKNILLHEIQHAIQGIEGFAKGGNLESSHFSDIEPNLAKIKRDKAKLKIDPYRIENMLSGGWKVSPEDLSKYKKWKQLTEQEDSLLKNRMSPFEAYRRQSGELEARAVQRRMNMTPEERAKTDVYAEEAIATAGSTNPNNFITQFREGIQASQTSKNTDPLLEEAKKYKSAEEFIQSQRKDKLPMFEQDLKQWKRLTDFRKGAIADELGYEPKTLDLYHYGKNGVDRGSYLSTDQYHAESFKEDGDKLFVIKNVPIEDLRAMGENRIIGKNRFDPRSSGTEFIYDPIAKTTIENKLTDIYNQAKGIKTPKQAFGAIAGVEYERDENGNITGIKYDPVKGAIGVGAMAGYTKIKGNKNLPDFLQEDLRKGIKIKKSTGVDIPEIGTLDELEQGEAKVQLAEVLKSLPDDLKKTYSNWVNGRRVTDIQGLRKRTDLVPRELDEGGIDTLIDFQKGGKNPSYKPIKQYFDNKHKELESAGINLGYRNNYIPQLWNNTEEEVLQAFGKRMTHKPSFTIDRVIESYEEGIKAGLKPKFNKLSDLVGWYESYANKALSDRQFFNELVKGKYLAQGSQAPKNWATLDPDRFKSFLTRIGKDRTYAGTYKAPEPLAKAINGYLTGGSQKLGNIAGVFSGVRQRILTGGIPQMGINAHGFNILARNTLANKNPVGALLKGSYYLINPRAADKNVKANLDKLEFFAKNGLVVNASDRAYTRLDDLVEDKAIVKGVRKIGAKWEENFEKPLFEKVIPALKINYADQVYKDLKKTVPDDDVAAKEASKIANNIFGGFNYEQVMRHPDTQNLMRTLLLAPDWLESNIRLGGNVAKGVIKMRDPQLKAYRTFARNFFLAFMSLQVMNMATSGKFTWDNDPGQEFSLDTGTYTKDGQKRYVRPFGTAVDFARLPYEFVSSLAKGDISYPFKAIGNRVNPVVSAGVHLAGNVDYRGNPIYGKDKYGKPMTASQQVVGVGNELSNVVGIPNPVRAVASTVTGRVSPEEGIVSALELPIRYKGGAYSKKDKELLAELQSEGASNEEIARALRGEDTKYTRSSDAPSTRLGQAGLNALSTVVNPVQTFQASRNNEPIRKLRIPEKGMGIGLLGSTTVTERQVGVGDRDGGDKNTQVDHIIPKWLGGREQDSNYQILSVQDHAKKTALGDRLRDQYENGEISRKQAISEIQKFNKTLSGQPLPKIEEKKTASSSTSVLDKEYTYTQPAPTDPLELEAYNNNILKDARSVYRSEKITEQEKQSLIEDMGLSVEDIELDTIGNAPVVERAIWVRDKLQQLPKDQHQAFLNSLYNTRTISGDRILTSSVAKKLGISGYGGSGGSSKKAKKVKPISFKLPSSATKVTPLSLPNTLPSKKVNRVIAQDQLSIPKSVSRTKVRRIS